MLYDPLAVKRLASAGCVLPPTPRSLSGPSGCQGCESSSTTESSREPGLDAGAPGRLYCVALQEEEQQRPVVGHGIVLEETSSQENLAKGKGRALGAERSSTEPFRKKDQATYLGAQRHLGGVGGCAHQQPGTRPPSVQKYPPHPRSTGLRSRTTSRICCILDRPPKPSPLGSRLGLPRCLSRPLKNDQHGQVMAFVTGQGY